MCIFNFIELTDVYIFSDMHGGFAGSLTCLDINQNKSF